MGKLGKRVRQDESLNKETTTSRQNTDTLRHTSVIVGSWSEAVHLHPIALSVRSDLISVSSDSSPECYSLLLALTKKTMNPIIPSCCLFASLQFVAFGRCGTTIHFWGCFGSQRLLVKTTRNFAGVPKDNACYGKS